MQTVSAPADPTTVPDDILDERQRMVIGYWQDLLGRAPADHLAHFHPLRLPPAAAALSMLLEVGDRPVRQAVLLWCGAEIVPYFPSDPTGRSLEALIPPSYSADLSPAYALCLSLGVPVAAVEEVSYLDGTRGGVRRLMLPVGLCREGQGQRASHLLVVYGPYDLPGHDRTPVQNVDQLASLTSHRLHIFSELVPASPP